MIYRYILYLIFSFIIFVSCNTTKLLHENESLVHKYKVEIKQHDISKKQKKQLYSDIRSLIRPLPNKSILGYKYKLNIYNIAGKPNTTKSVRHWLKYKIGEAPVIYKSSDVGNSSMIFKNFAENNGYFNIEINTDIEIKNQKATIYYYVNPQKQYTINNVIMPEGNLEIESYIRKTYQSTLLKKGANYNLQTIKAERNRIDSELKQLGFFYFSPDYLIFQIDSTVGNNSLDLYLKIKPVTPHIAIKRYKINDVYIFPNYKLGDSIKVKNQTNIGTIGYIVVDKDSIFKPNIFERTMYFNRKDWYNRTSHNLSLNRLGNMGTFKFVKNQFQLADSSDNMLDVYYYLTPLPRRALKIELAAKTNSANYTGSELKVNITNRNLWRGAEILDFSIFGGAEVQIDGASNSYNLYKAGAETNLVIPKIIAPFNFKIQGAYLPKTILSLSFETQHRQNLYSLYSFSSQYGYIWKRSLKTEHKLNITDIVFSLPQKIRDLYKEQIINTPSLSNITEKQLIFGPSYYLVITQSNILYNKVSVSTSGNLAGLFFNANSTNPKEFLGVPFSQFTKIENDFRYYYNITPKTQLANRIILGSGFAYGNSSQLPYVKQFFIGGAGSIRAFQARSVGPGAYKSDSEEIILFPEQSGNVKIEINSEYRFGIYRFVKGALFVDAGNIWEYNTSTNNSDSQFTSLFYKQLAVGTGFGLRFDFSFLVLRTDFAFPLRTPYINPTDSHSLISEINFLSKSWRKDNLVFNLAIGYPF